MLFRTSDGLTVKTSYFTRSLPEEPSNRAAIDIEREDLSGRPPSLIEATEERVHLLKDGLDDQASHRL
jgi:hypothetical protein